MDPRTAYREQYSPGWTRVDMLLALYDGAIARLEEAEAALWRGDRKAALPLLNRAQLIVCELAAGVDLNYPLAGNFLHLFGFAGRAISATTAEHVGEALRVLRTLREGFAKVRDEAARLEREGRIPPDGSGHLYAMA